MIVGGGAAAGAAPPPPASRGPTRHNQGVDVGQRMLIRCEGGLCLSRLVHFPPPLEIEERGGVYVLVDDGPKHRWYYQFIPDSR